MQEKNAKGRLMTESFILVCKIVSFCSSTFHICLPRGVGSINNLAQCTIKVEMKYGTNMNVVCLMFNFYLRQDKKLYIYLVLLENQIVIHSFAYTAQPSSDKLNLDVTGMVLVLLVGRRYVASPMRMNLPSCFDGQIEVWDYSYEHADRREEPLRR